MSELDAERRERLAEVLYDEGRVWLTPMQQALVVEHLAPLVAGWLADDTAVCTTCQHRGGDDQPAQHPGCAAALGRIRAAALRDAADGYLDCLCGHELEWHHAERGCQYHGNGPRRCRCLRDAPTAIGDRLRDRADRIGGAS